MVVPSARVQARCTARLMAASASLDKLHVENGRP